jgi:tetratricopeptide (TPR) repeat protein
VLCCLSFGQPTLMLTKFCMSLPGLLYFIPLLFLCACAGIQQQGEFSAGRQALLRGEPDNALAYFESVASNNPAFVTDSVLPRRSIWTYVGRAQYNAGRFAEASQAFKKALSYLSDDYIARLYLGLTLVRPLPPTAAPNAFKLQEVTFALREGVEPKRVATLARQRGVGFDLTRETEMQLRNAGADTVLINELKHLRVDGDKSNQPNEARRAQGRKELATALTGLRDWLDDFIRNTPQGRFWDPGQDIRKQIQLTLQQIAAQPTDWDEVILNAEEVGYKLEEENDRASRDESTERNRQLRR